MKKKKLTTKEFIELVRPMIAKIDDDLYEHDFGDRKLRLEIESLACDSEAVAHWVETLEFRLEQARLAACDCWNLSLCDLIDDLAARVGAEEHEARQAAAAPPAKSRPE